MDPATMAATLVRRLAEDEHYLFVDKPAGLAVTGLDRDARGALEALERLFGVAPLWPVCPPEQHVSGVLPLAKSEDAAARLGEALRSSSAGATYQAVVEAGAAPGRIRKPTKSAAATPRLDIQVLRSRRGRSLIAFRHPFTSGADVRASLRSARLSLLGEPRRQREQKPPSRPHRQARPAGRLFLHRGELRFRHPITGRVSTVKASAPAAFAAAVSASDLLEDALQVALHSRVPCLLDADTDAYRLFAGKPEGVPGLVADRLGPVVVLQTYQGQFQGGLDRVRRVAKWYVRTLGASAVYHKRFEKGRDQAAADDPGLHVATPLAGKPAAYEFPIRENGLRFIVRPYDGWSVGLFLDQRGNRERVRQAAAGKRVLNAFAYTCGFSVAAAAGGAVQTVSVDLSARALEWGRANFAANGIDPGDHLFFRSEVFAYLARAGRQGQSFDVIVLDAPTFARSKRPPKVFSIERDLRPLLTEAANVLAPGGTLLVSTNSRACSARWLREQVAAAASDARRPVQMTGASKLPIDFIADPGYAKSLLVQLG